MKNYLYPFIIVTLLIVLSIQHCSRPVKPIVKPNTTIIEEKITVYRDSIIYIDSIIIKYVSVRDSVSQKNVNSLTEHYDKQMDTLNAYETDYRDTLIGDLVYEIELQDTLIDILTDKTILQDTIIHNLSIMNETNKIYIEDVEKELVKSQKKIKRKNVWIIISTSIATILTTIIIVK